MSDRVTKALLCLEELSSALGDNSTVERLEIIAEVLVKKLTDDEVAFACEKALQTEYRFPVPAKLIELAQGRDIDNSQEAVGRIFESIKRFGYMGGAEARQHIGELGWRAVQAFGGWNYICSELPKNQVASTRAQMRDYLVSKQYRIERGIDNSPPQLEPANNVHELVSSLTNKIALPGAKS